MPFYNFRVIVFAYQSMVVLLTFKEILIPDA